MSFTHETVPCQAFFLGDPDLPGVKVYDMYDAMPSLQDHFSGMVPVVRITLGSPIYDNRRFLVNEQRSPLVEPTPPKKN